ncbi:MAG: DUF4212 domain-containing protein [Clostridia bacterium]|nr:DUF4212 domain-containing protein [Clostridia bacterium]
MDVQTPLPKGQESAKATGYISFFSPASEGMRAETRLISIIVIVWAVMVYIMPVLLIIFAENPEGASFLTRAKFLGFPFHYWYATQFTTIGFVLLCTIFSYFIDKVYAKYR